MSLVTSNREELIDWLDRIGIDCRDKNVAGVTIEIAPMAAVTITVKYFADDRLFDAPIPAAIHEAVRVNVNVPRSMKP